MATDRATHDDARSPAPTPEQDRLLSGLTAPQRDAVMHTDGPLLVLAGAGSGKTRVITRRAAYLACTVTRARHILAITFTNKAAGEMRERIDALGVAPGMTICTFHAFCAKMLRWHHDRAGVSPHFTIADREDRRKLLKQAVEACDLSATNWPAARVEQRISRAKNAMQSAEAFAADAVEWQDRTIARIYAAYERLLAENACLDFDDLLMRFAGLVQRDNGLRDQLEHRFRYVLVDEYQDTNASQYQIARCLTLDRRNLCVTGDPDQAIYRWRGADIENILSFERDYPDAKVVRLEQNYRSTKRILSAAERLIAGNVQRKAKRLWTDNDDGPRVRVLEFETADEEAQSVADDIAQCIARDASPRDVAVFYRVNALSRAIEEALIRAGVPYQVARGVAFYNRKEIKDVLAYLRVLVNPADEVSLLRIINTPARGIGATTIERLTARARRSGARVFDVLMGSGDLADLGRSAGKVRAFAALLQALAPATKQRPRAALEQVVSRSGLRAMYGDIRDGDGGPGANIDELISAAAQFQADDPDATLIDWLEHTALLGDVDGVRDEAGCVTLMTLHAAKGLEFPIVFMIGLEDGMLPFQRRDDTDCDEEEERRLCFVGMTRAKRRLTLCRARYRMLRGRSECTTRSRFLD
ncbi:MAG: ATP-dependent helicase, partial [Phycisphaerae bacterium]